MFVPHVNAGVADGRVLISSRYYDFQRGDGIFLLLLGAFRVFRGCLPPRRDDQQTTGDRGSEDFPFERTSWLSEGRNHSRYETPLPIS